MRCCDRNEAFVTFMILVVLRGGCGFIRNVRLRVFDLDCKR